MSCEIFILILYRYIPQITTPPTIKTVSLFIFEKTLDFLQSLTSLRTDPLLIKSLSLDVLYVGENSFSFFRVHYSISPPNGIRTLTSHLDHSLVHPDTPLQSLNLNKVYTTLSSLETIF